MKLTVKEYLSADGISYFREWLNGLDTRDKARIKARIFRFEMGNLGDHKSLGEGIWEARVMVGPGYRIYFGKEGLCVILLLLGGDKSSQSGDIGGDVIPLVTKLRRGAGAEEIVIEVGRIGIVAGGVGRG